MSCVVGVGGLGGGKVYRYTGLVAESESGERSGPLEGG